MDETETTPRIAPVEPPYESEVGEMLRRWMPPGSGLLRRTLISCCSSWW
jgi:hypothetical protein